MSLECDCGTELFEPDSDGCYTPDTEAWCSECGRRNVIDVTQQFNDDGPYDVAYAATIHEDVIDVGQPLCNGADDGCSKEWATDNPGCRCNFDCKRVTDEMRARFAGAVVEQKP